MAKKGLVKRTEGWVYVVQWNDRKQEVKIGFSTNLKHRLPEFLAYSTDSLLVLKTFRADFDKETELHDQFDYCRINGEWFRLNLVLSEFLKWKCPCDTKEARQDFGTLHKERILWRPLNPGASTRLEAAHKNTCLPRFVKNARMYTLWAVQDLNDNNYLCTPGAIISHPANNPTGDDWHPKVLYDEKTIYNRLSLLAQEGMVQRGNDKLYTITKMGETELIKTEERSMVFYGPRKSAKPLYPRMDFDK
jgi:hypothetical protein